MENWGNLVDDLRDSIGYMIGRIASITFHPSHGSNGGVWTIRGPKKNLIVMLRYDDEQLKPESTNNVTCSGTKVPVVNFSEFGTEVKTEVESLLLTVPNLTNRLEQHCELDLNKVIQNTTNFLNVGDLKTEHDIVDVSKTANSDSIGNERVNADVVHGENRVQNSNTSSMAISEFKTLIDSHFATRVVQGNEILKEMNPVTEQSLSSEANATVDFIPRSKKDFNEIETWKLRNCSVSLESLNISKLRFTSASFVLAKEIDNERDGNNVGLNRNLVARSDDKLHHCFVCATTFFSLDSYKLHVREKHFHPCKCENRSNRDRSAIKCFHCLYCKKRFRGKENLKKHESLHDIEGKPFQCLNCNRTFCRNSSLEQHKESCTKNKRYKCLRCGVRFTHAILLRRHIAGHEGQKFYERS